MHHRNYLSLPEHQFAVAARLFYKNRLLNEPEEPYGVLTRVGHELGLTDTKIVQIRNCEHSFIERLGVLSVDQWEHLLNQPKLKHAA